MNMKFYRKLPIPQEIKAQFPATAEIAARREATVKELKQILAGESNKVVCYRHGEIVTSEITWALALDKLFKSEYAGYKKADIEKLLAPYDDAEKASMYAFCENKLNKMKALYQTALDISN